MNTAHSRTLISCVGVSIRVYVRVWRRERGVKVTYTLFLFVNWTDYVWWSIRSRLTACIFSCLALSRTTWTWREFHPIGVLDSRKFLYLSLRKWMIVYFVKRLNVQSKHYSLRCKHLLYFKSNWLLEEFSQHIRIELFHLFYVSYCLS